MQNLIDDDQFHDWMIAQMGMYVQARQKYGKDLNVNYHLPGFRHITGKKHIEYKIRKRQNDQDRHGYELVKDMIKNK